MKKILILAVILLMSAGTAFAYNNRQHAPSRTAYRQYVQKHHVKNDQRRYRYDARYRALIDRRINQIVSSSYGRNDHRYNSYRNQYHNNRRNNRHHR
jgi:hypothetical protein